jgi:hypothetical protein
MAIANVAMEQESLLGLAGLKFMMENLEPRMLYWTL